MSTETYVVFSDVHGRRDLVRELATRHHDAQGFFFLGDGLSDLPELPAPLVAVRGNCDISLDKHTPEECLLDLGAGKILLMHGHRFGVKSGLERATLYAASRGADALLFGHTHLAEEHYLSAGEGSLLSRPMWVFNPGSLAAREFGLLQIQGGQMLFSHGRL